MEHRHLARLLACAALAAGVAGAQSVGTSRTAGAAASGSGSAAASGSVPLGTGTDGRTVIVITRPAATDANAMGAGPAAPHGPYSAVDIASMFMSADINHDGDLSRAEAQRLPLPMSFDDIDTNHDGVISRSEFDEAFR